MIEKNQLILASQSPRRKALMRKHGYKYRVVVSHVTERVKSGLSQSQLVKYLALKKARYVAKKNPDHIVLGADTLVFVQDKPIGKPRNPRHAAQILRTLSNRWQNVWTGVAVVWDGGRQVLVGAALSKVKFRRLTDSEIQRASSKHLDKAGGYAVQKKEDGFVEEIVGDYDNVVGLPMTVVKRLLGRVRKTLLK